MFSWLFGKKSFTDFPRHIQTAAFRWINMPSPWSSYLGGGLEQMPPIWQHLERKEKSLKNIRNDELRECARLYLKYYRESALPKYEDELRNKTTRKQLDEYSARQDIERKKVSGVLSNEPSFR